MGETPVKPDLLCRAYIAQPLQERPAVKELRGAGDKYTKVSDKKADLKPAAIDRLHRYFCGVATQAQRDTFIVWLKAVMDPAKITPTPNSATITLLKGFFDPQSQWLKEVLAIAQKPCPK